MLPDNSRLIFSSQQIHTAMDELAAKMNPALENTKPLVLCVMQGGLVFSGQLIPRLDCLLEIDYIHATRYQNGIIGSDIAWKAEPAASLDGRTILILDDILDEGLTLKAIKQYCKNQGAKQIFSAVLLHKKHNRGDSSVKADFVALEVEDSYVFGFGMDYEGRYRQLNAIYALENQA